MYGIVDLESHMSYCLLAVNTHLRRKPKTPESVLLLTGVALQGPSSHNLDSLHCCTRQVKLEKLPLGICNKDIK